VYLPLSNLYGLRWRTPETPLLAELRREIFAPRSYDEIDFRREARTNAHPEDVYVRATLASAHQAIGGEDAARIVKLLQNVVQERDPLSFVGNGGLEARDRPALVEGADEDVDEEVGTAEERRLLLRCCSL